VLDGAPLEGFLPPPRSEHAAPVEQLTRLLASQGLAAVREALAALPFYRLHRSGTAEAALLARILARYEARDLSDPGPVTALSMPERLAQVGVPTLVLNGEHDSPHRRLVGDALAYGLPRAQRLLLPAAGHLPNLDQPAAYAAAVLAFAAGLAGPTSP
jgi:pimeloyl-ACP methyl ester carboxylesterase